MASPKSDRAVELLLEEAWAAAQEGRYPQTVSIADKAVQAADQLGNVGLLVRALEIKEIGLRPLGEYAAALACCTRILALAEDPANAADLALRATARSIAQAHLDWVNCALNLTGIPIRDLFGVLEAADRWLTGTGHREWRAGVLLMRARVHRRLGQFDAAVADAQESLAVYQPGSPGTNRAGHRAALADFLRYAGRHLDAVPQYEAILDDPASSAHSQVDAHVGLAYCLLDTDDEASRRHATTALTLAESLGEINICVALDVLADACRGCGDLDAAWAAAERHLEVAERVGGHYRLYYACLTAADIALDRKDLERARTLVDELDRHSAALDASGGTKTYAGYTARRRQRLDALEAAG